MYESRLEHIELIIYGMNLRETNVAQQDILSLFPAQGIGRVKKGEEETETSIINEGKMEAVIKSSQSVVNGFLNNLTFWQFYKVLAQQTLVFVEIKQISKG